MKKEMKENFLTRMFGKSPEEVVESVSNPCEILLNTAIMFLSSIQQESQSCLPQCKEAFTQLAKLEKIGLGSSVNASRLRPLAWRYEEYLEAIKTIRFIKEVYYRFGSETLVMRPRHFLNVLERNDLVCGRLRYFKGELPPKALEEYVHADAMARRYGCLESRFASWKVPTHLPWATQMDCGGLALDESCAIAAPRECFIATPKRELDPFIFSYSELGYILIHAKWGPEAEDATIRRYEQLRDAVIGKGGAV